MGYHKDGKEYLDDTPIELPAGFKRPESIHDMIKRYIRSEQFMQKAAAAGAETEKEANDFDVDDDLQEEMTMTRHEFAAAAADELRELEGEEVFRRAKQELDAEYKKRMMELHANHGMQPEEEEDHHGSEERGGRKDKSGDKQRGTKGGRGRTGDAAEERDEVEREGRSAGKRRRRVSESGEEY